MDVENGTKRIFAMELREDGTMKVEESLKQKDIEHGI